MRVKTLLVERVVAVLTLNPGIVECLMLLVSQSLEGAVRVVAVQSSLRVHGTTLTFLIGFSFSIEMLYTALDGGVPRVMLSQACSLQITDRLYCLRSLGTISFHSRVASLLSSTLATSRATHEKLPRYPEFGYP